MGIGLNPLGDRVVIKRIEAEEKTKSGIVLPGQAKEQPNIAEVMAIGPQVLGFCVGDQVMFSKYAGVEVKHQGTDYIIMSVLDVLSVVE